MRVLISGASGLIGCVLRRRLAECGDETAALVRHSPRAGEVQWTPGQPLDPQKLFEFDAVVHLAGKNIAGRWTDKFKQEVREAACKVRKPSPPQPQIRFGNAEVPECSLQLRRSAITATAGTKCSQRTAHREKASWPRCASNGKLPPIRRATLVCASCICESEWCWRRMAEHCSRCCFPSGSGWGAASADGQQYWSWVTLEDVVGAFAFVLHHDRISGPVNVVAPNPARVAEFVRALGHVLHRPTIFPLPAFAVRTLLGEMGQALLLDSARVIPMKLEAAGYRFTHRDLLAALQAALNQT